MNARAALLLAVAGAALAPALLGEASGHGLGFDVAPPIDFGGAPVTVSTQLDPSDITAGEIDTASMIVRFFNDDTDETFEQVTYRIEVRRSGDGLLAGKNFYDDDGTLNLEVRPVYDCTEAELWMCTTYGGSPHVSAPEALYVHGDGRPTITGPIFDKGGLYNIRVDVIGATSPQVLVAERLSYDTFVSVAQEQPFFIQTAAAEEIPVVVKTYYDDVHGFSYNPADSSVTFDMPFDWSPDYVDLVTVVHQELQFPKGFEPYSEGKSFRGYVDGVEVDKRVLLLDPYSDEDTNIVHFLVSTAELQRINGVLGEEHEKSASMQFRLVPDDGAAAMNTAEFFLVDTETFERIDASVAVSWDSSLSAGDEIPLEIAFFDGDGNLVRDVRYAYFLKEPDGTVLLEATSDPEEPGSLGVYAPEGIDVQNVVLPSAGQYHLDVRILGTGINYDAAHAGIGTAVIEVGPAGPRAPAAAPAPQAPAPAPPPAAQQAVSIPAWVKDSAAWWAEGSVDDASFVAGIEFLIREGVISVPPAGERPAAGAAGIPEWVKRNAAWWAEGAISDGDFAAGLQYLVASGIIAV